MDQIQPNELDKILSLNMNYIQKRHLQGIIFFEQMAKYAPAFGLFGTTIGLVQLLANLKDPSMIGQGMSIALVSTFYGILIANFLFAPISGRLRADWDYLSIICHYRNPESTPPQRFQHG